ncbi:MAG: hypothetical protein ACR2HQ_03220 [Ilumatobacteraceae bacterium]
MTMNPHPFRRRLGVVIMLSAALAACGGEAGPRGAAPGTTVEPTISTGAAPPTTLAVVGAVTTATQEPTTSEASSTSSALVETTAGSAATSSAPIETPAVAMPEATPLVGGTRYVVPGANSALTPSVTVGFTAPFDGVFGVALDGLVGVALDEEGFAPLITIAALDRAVAVKDPVVDFSNLVISDESADTVEDVPVDYLAWFAERPGITAGPVTEARFGGLAARSMSYEVGAVPGAFPCAPDLPPCLAWLYFRVGILITNYEGDVGTLYELDVDGRRVLVDVADEDGAAQLADSVELIADGS